MARRTSALSPKSSKSEPSRPESSLDIAQLRLANQHLTSQVVAEPSEAVALLGAIQAQDYTGAKWAIGQRTTGATDALVQKEIDGGRILRTHVLRPTWHFVSAGDIRWMLALTAPRIRASVGYYDRRLGIDEEVRRRTRAVLTRELRNREQLTRLELAKALTKAGVRTDGTQRLAHLMIHAELDGLVCSGARRGKQFTYALLDECAPPTKELERDVALHTLASRYFTTRGPATERDFAWWSGLSRADAKAAMSSVDGLKMVAIDGDKYWFAASTPTLRKTAKGKTKEVVRLLASYDEYLVSYADRSATHRRVDPAAVGETFDFLGSNVITIDGQIVGRWKKSIGKKGLTVMVEPLTRMTGLERDTIEREGLRFAAFLELPLHIEQAARKAGGRRL